MNGERDEPQALATWCEWLPKLRDRVRASRGDWGPRLERVANRVREGGSAIDACDRYRRFFESPDEEADGPGRGPLPPESLPRRGVPPVPAVGRGNYRCPRRLCVREGERDDQGHPPICETFAEPMQPAG